MDGINLLNEIILFPDLNKSLHQVTEYRNRNATEALYDSFMEEIIVLLVFALLFIVGVLGNAMLIIVILTQ